MITFTGFIMVLGFSSLIIGVRDIQRDNRERLEREQQFGECTMAARRGLYTRQGTAQNYR